METLNLLSAFKVEGNTYVVLDSERTGSMGLPIIYVSKLTDHLEKITLDNEWQNVKNYLKGIINGTNFEYVNINENETADEAYYKELSLPNIDSFNAIKNRYLPKEEPSVDTTPTMVEPVTPNETQAEITPAPPVEPVAPVMQEPVEVAPVAPASVEPSLPKEEVPPVEVNSNVYDFSQDKETFLKACENMFDALVSKYQKELNDLAKREEELAIKEKDIAAKMQDASEHLRNAEAREQVANIAHDNAQKVMDLNNFMPINPNGTN